MLIAHASKVVFHGVVCRDVNAVSFALQSFSDAFDLLLILVKKFCSIFFKAHRIDCSRLYAVVEDVFEECYCVFLLQRFVDDVFGDVAFIF